MQLQRDGRETCRHWVDVFVWFCIASHLAPDETERPDGNDVNDGGERHTDDDKDEVGCGESDDENVGRIAHVLVSHNDHNHRQITDEAECRDETEYDRNDDADEVLENDVGAGISRAVGCCGVVDASNESQ